MRSETRVEPILEKERLMRRLRRIEGQTRGLQHMVTSGRNCQEILVQITSVKAALEQVSLMLAEQHLTFCFRGLTKRLDDATSPEQMIQLIRLIHNH